MTIKLEDLGLIRDLGIIEIFLFNFCFNWDLFLFFGGEVSLLLLGFRVLKYIKIDRLIDIINIYFYLFF